MKKTLLIPLAFKQCWFTWVSLVFVSIGLISCTQAPSTAPVFIRTDIKVDSKQIAIQVPQGASVQTALDQANISLNNLDRVDPPGYTILQEGDEIHITRVREDFSIKEVVLPFEKKTLNNETLPEGQTLLVQRGVNGVERVTYRQVFEDDHEVSNIVFKSETALDPLPEIIMVGVQKPFTPLSIPGKLAYLTGGNAWLMETTTGDRRPVITTGDLDGRVFKLSPKGDWLLFTRKVSDKNTSDQTVETADINSLWAVDLTEENPKPVNLGIRNIIHFADWAPNKGLTIIYSTVEPRSTAPGWQANNDVQLAAFSPTGKLIRQETILEANAGGFYGWWGMSFAWSPDGSLLAYSRPDEIGLVDLNEKTTLALAEILPFQTGSDWAWVPGIGWSAAGNVLYLTNHAPKAGLESQETSPLFDLSAIAIDAENLQASGPLITIAPQAGMFAYPVSSPQNQIAYLQAIFPEQSDSKRYRLVVMDRDGSNRTTIFPAEDRQGMDPQNIVWSPQAFVNENEWLAVIYQGNMWFVDAIIGDAQQVTGDGLVTHIDWK